MWTMQRIRYLFFHARLTLKLAALQLRHVIDFVARASGERRDEAQPVDGPIANKFI